MLGAGVGRPSPHGEGGLKLVIKLVTQFIDWSLPAWGGWIEMFIRSLAALQGGSLPAWGGWIEMKTLQEQLTEEEVPPRMGRVD